MAELEIDADELHFTEDYIYYYRGEYFTGVAREYIHGRLVRESRFWDGAKHGLERIWDYETGALLCHKRYRMNTGHGIQEHWYVNGQREYLELIEYGVATRRVTWNQWGEVVERYELHEGEWLYSHLQSSRRIALIGGPPEDPPDEEQMARLNELDELLEEEEMRFD